jgi:PqqD family protein of HPr-rel-A system
MAHLKNICWRTITDFDICWHHWGDEYIAYHSGSGETHLLDPILAEILKSLLDQPANISELAGRVASSLELVQDDEMIGYVEQAALDFQRLGLIERVHC